MSSADSALVAVRDALISAISLSLSVTASIPGDIPSLLEHAYSRHFDEQIPPIKNLKSITIPASTTSLESLIATLSKIPPLEPSAQTLLDRAQSIITSAPPLSMNLELADGEELPVALHTLNQGAVWACLMGGGANPDLEDRVPKEAQEHEPDGTEMHDKIRNALAPEAKCLWFLCRKFFFTLNVAEKDGESYQFTGIGSCYHHRMYMGRLFMLYAAKHAALTRARMPRALEVYSNEVTHIARTPKGLWGWGYNLMRQLGSKSSDFVDPTRLTFTACPKVTELEASLTDWEKHRMVTDVSMEGAQTFILTPVETVMSGSCAMWFVGANSWRFHPVAVPAGFVPDHIMHAFDTVILSMGDQQVISGDNYDGQLGLGHRNDMTGFEELPFSVDRIISRSRSFNTFLSNHRLLYVGRVSHTLAASGVLPGRGRTGVLRKVTPLRLLERVKAVFCECDVVVWVSEGRTMQWAHERWLEVPFEAASFSSPSPGVAIMRNSSGQWFEVSRRGGTVVAVECKPPSHPGFDLIPVDLWPWSLSTPGTIPEPVKTSIWTAAAHDSI
ncbi:hypothetical protein J8273_3276 [Carpediemonas membranifera]|uniref:Uncharacterized protein n=1 Tax=Carpediemonas membranifera TaxID=201153 RepID=A0A8J6BA59_9EUKA|nr:hypothetical protein J8273_3276 [Carpediemonas membranifera]|eukprot:KAG9393147.1 hypothetical protein J8273_3276 [Carpediemonas membranifera]